MEMPRPRDASSPGLPTGGTELTQPHPLSWAPGEWEEAGSRKPRPQRVGRVDKMPPALGHTPGPDPEASLSQEPRPGGGRH